MMLGRKVRPSEVTILVGIPVCKPEWEQGVATTGAEVPNRALNWGDYWASIGRPVHEAVSDARTLGARVHTHASIEIIGEAATDAKVIILFSHQNLTPAVEFREGMIPIADVAARFPASFDGIVDAWCCTTLDLPHLIKLRARGSHVRGRVLPLDIPRECARLSLTVMALACRISTYEDATSRADESVVTGRDPCLGQPFR